MHWFRSLTFKMVAVSAMAVLAATGLMTLVSWQTLETETDTTLRIKTEWSLRVAAEAFISYYPDFELAYGADGNVTKLTGQNIADFSDNDAVDRISRINKGTATVFRFDPSKNDFVRLSTSVKKADGTRAIGTVLGNAGVVFPVIMSGKVFKGVAQILGEPYQTGYMPIVDKANKPIGILYIGVGKVAELRAATNKLLEHLLLVSLIVLLVSGAAITYVLSRSIVKPVVALANATRDIAAEKLTGTVPHQDKTDECGLLARSLASLQTSMAERAALRDQNDQDRISEIAVARKRDEEIQAFRNVVSGITKRLSLESDNMKTAAHRLSETVSSTAVSAGGAKVAAGQTAQGIGVVASAADQLNASIREVSHSTEQAALVAAGAVTTGAVSQEGVGNLSKAAQKIGDVVTVIRSIAEQTNLLALNATIEAARAGDAGRGFAVVASEVKALASQTSAATEEISTLVSTIQSASTGVVGAFDGIMNALNDVKSASSAISTAVEEQGAATGEIARSASQAAAGAEEMTNLVQSVEDLSDKTKISVESLEITADVFRKEADGMVAAIDAFLQKVAA